MDRGGRWQPCPGVTATELIRLGVVAQRKIGAPGCYLIIAPTTMYPSGLITWVSRKQLELTVRIEMLKVRRAELITDALSELLTPDVALMGDRHGLRRDPDVSPDGVYRS